MCKFFFNSPTLTHAWEVTSAKYLVCIFLDLHAYIHLHIRKHLTWGFCYVLAVWGASLRVGNSPGTATSGPCFVWAKVVWPAHHWEQRTPKAGPFMPSPGLLWSNPHKLRWPWQGPLAAAPQLQTLPIQSPILPLPSYGNICTMM